MKRNPRPASPSSSSSTSHLSSSPPPPPFSFPSLKLLHCSTSPPSPPLPLLRLFLHLSPLLPHSLLHPSLCSTCPLLHLLPLRPYSTSLLPRSTPPPMPFPPPSTPPPLWCPRRSWGEMEGEDSVPFLPLPAPSRLLLWLPARSPESLYLDLW